MYGLLLQLLVVILMVDDDGDSCERARMFVDEELKILRRLVLQVLQVLKFGWMVLPSDEVTWKEDLRVLVINVRWIIVDEIVTQ